MGVVGEMGLGREGREEMEAVGPGRGGGGRGRQRLGEGMTEAGEGEGEMDAGEGVRAGGMWSTECARISMRKYLA